MSPCVVRTTREHWRKLMAGVNAASTGEQRQQCRIVGQGVEDESAVGRDVVLRSRERGGDDSRLRQHFRDFFDYRAFLAGMGAAVVGALIFRALTSFPFWVCFVMVIVVMLLNSWLLEWEDNQPGGFNNPKTDDCDAHRQ
jgi:hypothetical protein